MLFNQTLTFALYDICMHREYVAPLRDELSGPAFQGFERDGQGLPLMDSFLKESARLTPIEGGKRLVLHSPSLLRVPSCEPTTGLTFIDTIRRH